MKKMTFKVCMAACCAALAFSACSEEDGTLHGVAPSEIGTISLDTDKDQVRPGQPLTASIALPTGGQNISEVTYKWGALNEFSDKEENGTAYFSFTAPEEPGQYSLSFNAHYLFLGPDAEGNFYKDMSSTLDYTVISCDIFSSFWDDDLATTLKVYPRLTESTSQPGTYLGTFADKLSSSSFSTINRAFTFNDNMTIGETYTVNIAKDSTTVKDALKKFVESYNKLIDDVYGYIGKSPAKDDDGNTYEPLTNAEKDEMSEDEITKWEEKAKQGVLYNDSTVSTVMSQMRSALYTSVTLDDGSKFGIYNLGIKTSSEWSEHGKLQIDENAFDKAFENNEDAIIKLFTDSDTGMMKKLNSVIDGAVKSSGAANTRGTLVRKAGKADSSVTTDSTIYKEMVKMQDRLKELQDRYDTKEEYWWKVFTNMETAMADLNSQTSYISSYLGTGTSSYQ